MRRRNAQKVWVGFDLGGTKMLAAVFDAKLAIRGRQKHSTKAHLGVRAGRDRIVLTIREALAAAKVSPKSLGGIGIGCPGPVDPEAGVLLDPPNLGWKNVPICRELQKEFGCPVALANDVDAGVYGEYVKGAARGARCVLGVFPGTGIGGGCVYEGRILRGLNRSCMEIGHMQVLPGGPLCGCGRRGCLEAVASRLAISAEVAKAAFRGQAPTVAKEAGMDLSDIRSRTLAAAIAAGNVEVERIVRDAAQWLGIGVAAAVNMLAPDVLLLGGGLVEAMPKFYLKTVVDTARANTMASLRRCFRVAVSELGDDAIIVGAAAWVRDHGGSAR